MIRVLIADDHTILRHSLSRTLEEQDDIEVVGQARDGLSTCRKARELSPDVVIMDVGMPDMNGIEATREITRDHPKVKVVALSMHRTKRYVIEMFKAGAAGYLSKDCEFEELLLALRTVMEGKTYLSPSITDLVLDNYIRAGESPAASAFSQLTSREREVLQLTAEGNTTKQIGRKLHISPKTVEAHRLRVMTRLGLDNIAQLTKYAIQEGLTSPEP